MMCARARKLFVKSVKQNRASARIRKRFLCLAGALTAVHATQVMNPLAPVKPGDHSLSGEWITTEKGDRIRVVTITPEMEAQPQCIKLWNDITEHVNFYDEASKKFNSQSTPVVRIKLGAIGALAGLLGDLSPPEPTLTASNSVTSCDRCYSLLDPKKYPTNPEVCDECQDRPNSQAIRGVRDELGRRINGESVCTFLFAFDGDVLVGALYYGRSQDHLEKDQVMEIGYLVAWPPGHRYGTELAKLALKKMKDANAKSVVLSSLPKAKVFWSKHGFKPNGAIMRLDF